MNMIERVARAILKVRFYDCEPDAYGYREETFWKELDPDHIIDAYDEARAAIKAMREPTQAMMVQMEIAGGAGMRGVWWMGIEAALQEDGE